MRPVDLTISTILLAVSIIGVVHYLPMSNRVQQCMDEAPLCAPLPGASPLDQQLQSIHIMLYGSIGLGVISAVLIAYSFLAKPTPKVSLSQVFTVGHPHSALGLINASRARRGKEPIVAWRALLVWGGMIIMVVPAGVFILVAQSSAPMSSDDRQLLTSLCLGFGVGGLALILLGVYGKRNRATTANRVPLSVDPPPATADETPAPPNVAETGTADEAIAALRLRLARGEIDEPTFERRFSLLKESKS